MPRRRRARERVGEGRWRCHVNRFQQGAAIWTAYKLAQPTSSGEVILLRCLWKASYPPG